MKPSKLKGGMQKPLPTVPGLEIRANGSKDRGGPHIHVASVTYRVPIRTRTAVGVALLSLLVCELR